jgi:antitoxin MazE
VRRSRQRRPDQPRYHPHPQIRRRAPPTGRGAAQTGPLLLAASQLAVRTLPGSEGTVKLVNKAEIEENDWGLTPDRYVDVAPEEAGNGWTVPFVNNLLCLKNRKLRTPQFQLALAFLRGYTRDIHRFNGGKMHTKIQKWGNSQGLRIPKAVLDEIQSSVGDEVAIYSQEGKIIIEPVKRVRGKISLKTLIKKIPKNYQAQETDWGKPLGKEEW